jgi:hypothetical protein
MQKFSRDHRLSSIVEKSYNPSTQEAEAEDREIEASLCYIARPCFKNENRKACRERISKC